MRYGISMKPGDQGQPGPSTKAAQLVWRISGGSKGGFLRNPKEF